jgi:diguanylate cyclase (GGDEF)-like protein
MKNIFKNSEQRDRAHKAINNFEALSNIDFGKTAAFFMEFHIILEFIYFAVGCTPMVIINIISILSYIAAIYFYSKDYKSVTIWIILIEVYLHVVLATVFMGIKCGFTLWLFGTFSSVFLPFFSPTLTRRQKLGIFGFSLLIVISFLLLTVLGNNGSFPNTYNPPVNISNIFYFCNAIVGFSSITVYTSSYNTRIQNQNDQLQLMADHDYLTGMYNRQRIQSILEAEMKHARNNPDTNISIAIMDIDYFKRINDTYGHPAGDSFLKDIAAIFDKYAEKGLLYGRWGGEEFLFISPEHYSYSDFALMLDSIRKEIEAYILVDKGNTIHTTASFGAALYQQGMTLEKFVTLADSRLYEAKGTGRNKVVF